MSAFVKAADEEADPLGREEDMRTNHSRPHSALVVDDEYLIALDASEAMREMGVRIIGPARSFQEACACIEREPPDFAVLDLHLGRGGRGEDLIPVLTASGCDCLIFSGDELAIQEIERRFPHWPILRKPATKSQIGRAVRRLVNIPATERMAVELW